MKTKLLLMLWWALLITSAIQSQNTPFCKHDEDLKEAFRLNPDYEILHENHLKNAIALSKRVSLGYSSQNRALFNGQILNNEKFIIPVVVHVIHQGEPYSQGSNISNEQVASAIEGLNSAYAGDYEGGINSNISFCLAQTSVPFPWSSSQTEWSDVGGGAYQGIMRYQNPYPATQMLSNEMVSEVVFEGNATIFPSTDYLNIVIASSFTALGVSSTVVPYEADYFTGASGYHDYVGITHFAFGLESADVNNDFSLDSNFPLNGTISHEVGHRFGLGHTDTGCFGLTLETCEQEGDRICDTPPSILNMGNDIAGPFYDENGIDVGNSCQENIPYSTLTPIFPDTWVPFPNPLDLPIDGNVTDLYDIPENYMSRNSDGVRRLFSQGQIDRMGSWLEVVYPHLSSYENLLSIGIFNAQCLGDFELISSEFNTDNFDPCLGIIELSAPTAPFLSNSSFNWLMNGVSVGTSASLILDGLGVGSYTISLEVTSDEGGFCATDQLFEIKDCTNGCNLICNSGFEYNDVGSYQSTCTTPGFDLSCWDSHGYAHLNRVNEPNFIWTVLPYLPLNFSPIPPENLYGNTNSLSTDPLYTENESYMRFSRAKDNQHDLYGGVTTSFTPTDTKYVFKYYWAYQTNLQDINQIENRIGFTSGNNCNGVENGPFPAASVNLSHSPSLSSIENMWYEEIEVVELNTMENGIQFSVAETEQITQANYYYTMFLDDVVFIPSSASPVSVSIENLNPEACDDMELQVTISPDINDSQIYNTALNFGLKSSLFADGMDQGDYSSMLTYTSSDPNVLLDANGNFTLPAGTLANNASYQFNITVESTNANEIGTLVFQIDDLKDGDGCIGHSPVVSHQLFHRSVFDITHASCFGECDGKIQIKEIPSLANGDAEWAFDNGTFQPFSTPLVDLCPGTYELRWTENGCSRTFTVELLEPASVVSETTVLTEPVCEGGTGSIELIISGGWTAAQYEVEWSDNSNTPLSVGSILYNVPMGTYWWKVTAKAPNEEGVDYEGNFPLQGLVNPNSFFTQDCLLTGSATLLESSSVSIPELTVIQPSCDDPTHIIGGEIGTANFNDDWELYLVNPDGTVLADNGSWNDLPMGAYTVGITSLTGCFKTEQVIIENTDCCANNPLSLSYTVSGDQCYDSNFLSVDLTVQGGELPYEYNWFSVSSPQGTLTPLLYDTEDLDNVFFGSYSVEVVDHNGCTIQEQIALPVPAQIGILVLNQNNVSCAAANDGSFSFLATDISGMGTSITVTGPNGFLANDQTILENLEAGEYQILVTDIGTGCSKSQPVFIEVGYLSPYIVSYEEGVLDCDHTYDVDVTISGTPNVHFNWRNENGQLISSEEDPNLTPGVYELTVEDASGCSNQTEIVNITLEESQIQYSETITNTCSTESNGEINITISVPNNAGTETISWFDAAGTNLNISTSNISGLAVGTYSFLYENSVLGCLYLEDIEITALDVTCETPENVEVLFLSDNSVEITWTDANSGANGYEIRYRVVGTTEWFYLTEETALDMAVINGLDLIDSTYEFQVSTLCNECSQSDFSGEVQPAFEFCDDQEDWNAAFNDFAGFSEDFTSSLEEEIWATRAPLVVIAAGTTVELTNKTLLFNGESSTGDFIPSIFVLQEGATLILNNCVLTSCNPNWEGVVIYSDSSTPEAPGKLVMNGGEIRNSKQAIYTRDENPNIQNLGSLPTWEGAEINLNNVGLTNNLVAIDLSRSVNLNSSDQPMVSFDDCQFKKNEAFSLHFPNEDFQTHVKYAEVKGYAFKDCVFTNDSEQITEWEQLGTGISTMDAIYDVKNCRFSNFYKGIDAQISDGRFNGMIVRDSRFTKCRMGIYNYGECYQSLILNNFTLGDPTGIAALDNNLFSDREGIVLDGCGAFEVGENTINGYQENGSYQYNVPTVGIRVRDILGVDAEVRKNYLNGLENGTLANGDNTGYGTSPTGLRFVCNVYTENKTDIRAAEFPDNDPMAYMGSQQGEAVIDNTDIDWTDAGNEFSLMEVTDTPDPEQRHFNHTGAQIDGLVTYYAWSGEYSLETLNFSANVTPNFVSPNENQCPQESLFPIGTITDGKLDDYQTVADDAEIEYDGISYVYAAMVDNGETEELQEEVDFSWSDEVWIMREKLLATSPFVSKEVMYKVLNRTSVFPHPIAFEILVANPDLLKDKSLIKYLRKKADPMPEYLIDLLYAARNQKTFKTELLQDMAIAKTKEIHAKNVLMRVKTLSGEDPEGVFDIMLTLDGLHADMLLAEMALGGGDLIEAEAYRASVEDRREVRNQRVEDEIEAFKDWYELKKEVYTNYGGSWKNTPPLAQTALKELAQSYYTFGGKRARHIMNFYFGTEYFTPPAYGENLFKSAQISGGINPFLKEPVVEIYPNPAAYLLNITLDYSQQLKTPDRLVVLNVEGKVIEQRILNNEVQHLSLNTTKWPAGSYMIQIMSQKSILNAKKIEIIH